MDLIQVGIAAIAVVVAGLFVAGQFKAGAPVVPSALAAAAWLGLWFALASTGIFEKFDARPPPFALVFAGTVAMGLGLGLSRVGVRISQAVPLGALIMAQGFRLPLEVVMHEAAARGVMPVQMSWSGWNFDVITGASALLVGTLSLQGKASKRLLWAWTALSFVTLFVVVGIAVASIPLFHAFGTTPERLNTWVARPPYVWLPTVMVAGALAGQLIIVRRLRALTARS